ncbi:uncharacterized protein LOC110820393 [Carica papaya]|uniref:uncharacterized protein LOC110820393 n=1 Tax=Carica papaya TaxID=3649 RepID=UPI000B8CA358|nr:uncharacterized protein LOC110820393 [Carica papaya]
MSSETSSSGFILQGLDDVEDYILDNEGERSFPWDRYSHVVNLVLSGNQAFRENRFEEAINSYSRANCIKPVDPIILSNRSTTYIRISQFLKQRTASASEYQPLNGLDMTTLAELALKDAEKVMSLQNNSIKSYILKASALILLEKYEMARNEGGFNGADQVMSNFCLRSLKVQSLDSLVVCGLACTSPCCIFIGYNIVHLLNRFSFMLIIIFLKQVRRIMEGNHRMGMVTTDPATGSIADFACEVEITECEPLPDGRFVLEIESRRRCRILRSWDQDGYRVAEVEWVQDIPPSTEGDRTDLLELTSNAAAYAQSWLTTAKQAARQDRRRLERLLNVESMMPTPQDPERFSFWLATLSDRRPPERLDLLRIRDSAERIRRGLIYLRAEEQGCRVQ